MTGIIGALDREVDALLAAMTDKTEHMYGRLVVYVGRIEGQETAVCRSGVGKVSAAYAASVLTTVLHVDEIINTGVAGGTVPRGSMVLADKLVQHDVRSYADDLPAGQVEGFDLYFQADAALVRALAAAAGDIGLRPVIGTIASGDQFICDGKTVAWLKETFDAKAVDMESAAIAQVCAMAGARFAAVRTVTDNADEQAVGDFYELVAASADRSAAVLTTYLRTKTNKL